ncbi:proteophosphoglycan ppg4 [Rhodotorula toruloides]|uniref:Proteophosphoglycan ppg4 n=1 Tax=Rhodotorula toruloides TaxID=5286 RepID=A0A511KBT5_RHOTO|nr:proteophosphoglycan ppg4 [Rhodotorula toruloides]
MSTENVSPEGPPASQPLKGQIIDSQETMEAKGEGSEAERDAEDSLSSQDDSFAFSSQGSIVYRDSETSGEFAPSTSVVQDQTGASNETLTSYASVLGDLAALTGPQATPSARSVSLPTAMLTHAHKETTPERDTNNIDEGHSPRKHWLNPAASSFTFRSVSLPASTSAGSVLDCKLGEILKTGKDSLGNLTNEAKVALGELGLQPIPSLHGAPKFPYARNPSGVDLFHFSVAEEDPAFIPLEQMPDYQPRTVPLPLPGNSRYTHHGRLAQQRNISAPATLAFTHFIPTTSSTPPIAPKTARAASAPTRRGGRLKKSQPGTALASTHGSPPTPAPSVEYIEIVALDQARLAQQVQHAQIAQAQTESRRQTFQQLVNNPLWPFVGSQIPTHVYTADVSNSPFAATPYPISTTPLPNAMPSLTPSTIGRRPSIVIGPDGQVNVVDSGTFDQFAMQMNFGFGQPPSTSTLSSRSTSWKTDASVSSQVYGGAAGETYYPLHDEAEDEMLGVPRPPTRAEQLARRTRPGHRRSTKSTDITPQAAQSYLEKGRRSSAAAFVPHPDVNRKSSPAPSTSSSRNVTGPAKMPQPHARPSHSRQSSCVVIAEDAPAEQKIPPPPPPSASPTSSTSFPPSRKAPKFRAFSDIGNSVSSAKVTSYAGQLDQQPRHISSPPVVHNRTVPQVKLEPPTPKKPSRKQSKGAKTPSVQVEKVTDSLTALKLAASTEQGRSTTPSVTSEAYVTATEGDGDPNAAGGPASPKGWSRRRKRNSADGASAGQNDA